MRLLLLSLWIGLLSSQTAGADELTHESQPDWWQNDASLQDVWFADANTGWAVGSHGTLLRTTDGGTTWQRGDIGTQTAGADRPSVPLSEKISRTNQHEWIDRPQAQNQEVSFSTRFESVFFTDPKRGWAVGGYELPGLSHSRAVVATTRDGGQTWRELPNQLAPYLKAFAFPNPNNNQSGWAVGHADPATGSSVYFSTSGGSVWSSQQTKPMPGLKRAVAAGNGFIVIDQNGNLGSVAINRFEYAVVSTRYAPVINDVIMTDAGEGWAVGAAGVVVRTIDGGKIWAPVTNLKDNPAIGFCNFRAICQNESDLWIGGTAGRFLYRVDRVSGNAQAVELPANASINRIRFADAKHGWAVGDYGVIFATRDGGATWKLQRRGAGSAASSVEAVIFTAANQEMPLEFLARQCIEKGKRIAVRVFVRPQDHVDIDAMRCACERIGIRSVEPIYVAQDRPDKQQFLIGSMVQQIRHLRPAIVAVAGDDLSPVVAHAVEQAASQSAFAPQLGLGLSPWQTRWQIELVGSPNRGIGADKFLPQVGVHLSDLVLLSRLMLGRSAAVLSTWNAMNFSIDYGQTVRRTLAREDPFTKVDSARGFTASIAARNLHQIRSIVQKRNTIDQLTKLLEQSPNQSVAFDSELRRFSYSLTGDTGSQSAGGLWLYQLSDRLLANGHPQQAIECLELLAQIFPNHSLAPLANTRLARHFSSGEWAKVAQGYPREMLKKAGVQRIGILSEDDSVVQQASLGDGKNEYRWTKPDLNQQLDAAAESLPPFLPDDAAKPDPATMDLTVDVSPEALQESVKGIESIDRLLKGEDPINEPSPVNVAAVRKERFLKAAEYFSRIGQLNPGLVKRSDYRFLQAHIVRQLSAGQPVATGSNPAHYFELTVKNGDAKNPFVLAAATEARLATDSLATGQQLFASRAAERPLLDGLANEKIWNETSPATNGLQISEKGNVGFAWDKEHFYILVQCQRLAHASINRPTGMRTRDAKLNPDFVTLRIDCDRDLGSAWTIRVDQNGQLQESCDTMMGWNPKIFAAHHAGEDSWSVEIAIPLDELCGRESLNPNGPWLVGAERSLSPPGPQSAGPHVLSFR